MYGERIPNGPDFHPRIQNASQYQLQRSTPFNAVQTRTFCSRPTAKNPPPPPARFSKPRPRSSPLRRSGRRIVFWELIQVMALQHPVSTTPTRLLRPNPELVSPPPPPPSPLLKESGTTSFLALCCAWPRIFAGGWFSSPPRRWACSASRFIHHPAASPATDERALDPAPSSARAAPSLSLQHWARVPLLPRGFFGSPHNLQTLMLL
jgi:hypothetical protein